MHKIWQNSWDGSNTGNFILRMLFYISWLAQFWSIKCKHWGFRRGPIFFLCSVHQVWAWLLQWYSRCWGYPCSAFIPPRLRRLEDLKHLWLKISKTKVSKAYLFLEETRILVLEETCQIYSCFFGCSDFFVITTTHKICFSLRKQIQVFTPTIRSVPLKHLGSTSADG